MVSLKKLNPLKRKGKKSSKSKAKKLKKRIKQEISEINNQIEIAKRRKDTLVKQKTNLLQNEEVRGVFSEFVKTLSSGVEPQKLESYKEIAKRMGLNKEEAEKKQGEFKKNYSYKQNKR